ncbi:MAG: GIY-YIG nuclease family protein [Promethearchaeota archaeon]
MAKGTYILVIYFENDEEYLEIGKLGKIKFKKGFYFYVGSAMGSKNSSVSLENRIKRHLRSYNYNIAEIQRRNLYNKHNHKYERPKRHWHIDYLLTSKFVKIVRIWIFPSLERLECTIAHKLMEQCEDYIEGFGSSDCNCKSHLFYFKELKNEYEFL